MTGIQISVSARSGARRFAAVRAASHSPLPAGYSNMPWLQPKAGPPAGLRPASGRPSGRRALRTCNFVAIYRGAPRRALRARKSVAIYRGAPQARRRRAVGAEKS